MSGATINDEIMMEGGVMPEEYLEVDNNNNMSTENGFGIDLSILKAKTGEGAIEDYIQHPLNFNNSHGLARIIRGFTGILGALDLAIIDIGVGVLEFFKDRRTEA